MLITNHFAHPYTDSPTASSVPQANTHISGSSFFFLDTTGFILQSDFNWRFPQFWVAHDHVCTLIQGQRFI